MTEELKPKTVEQEPQTTEVSRNPQEVAEVTDQSRQSIEQNLNPELAKFRELFDELFVQNITREKGDFVSPLNCDSISQKHSGEAQKEKKQERELYNSLKVVKEAIERDSGISEETYETHKYAINSLSRDLTNQRWWGSALTHLCEAEDREGKSPTSEQIARFPEDGNFSENGHTNIFDEGYKTSGFEGTLFQREFDESGILSFFRVFHQGHRDRLIVETANIQELTQRINSFVADFVDEVPKPDFGLTLGKDEYLAKITEFNSQFGDIVSLEIENNSVVAKFPENPQQLAERLVQNGQGLKSNMGTVTYTVMSGEPDYHYIDILLPDHLQRKNTKFDAEQHKDSPSIILPYLNPEFSKTLLELAILKKSK